jgi:hypothetical protein
MLEMLSEAFRLARVVATPFLLQIGVKLGQVVQGMINSISCTEAADIRPGDFEIPTFNVHRSPSGDVPGN